MAGDYSTTLGDEARYKYAASIAKTNTEDTKQAKIEADREQLTKDQGSLFTLVNDVQNGDTNAINFAQSAKIVEPAGVNSENEKLVNQNNKLLEKAKTEAEKQSNSKEGNTKLAATETNIAEIKKILEAQGDTDITDADIEAYLNNQMK